MQSKAELLATYGTEALLALLEMRAADHYDGHFSVIRSTTDWKVAFGRPDPDEIGRLPSYLTLRQALIGALLE